MAYITIEELKLYTTINEEDADEVVKYESLIENSSDYISNAIGFDPEGTTVSYKDIISIQGNKFSLPFSPIKSIEDLSINEYFYYEIPDVIREGFMGEDFVLNKKNGVITFLNKEFSGKYKIDCDLTTGFETVPNDLKQACAELTIYNYQKILNSSFGIKSTMSGDSTTTYENGIPYSVKLIIDRYNP